MTSSPNVLLVAPTRALSEFATAALTAAGLRVTIATSFAAARELLLARPSLLISEVRLGTFNGLHLALRALGEGIPAIVLGQQDAVLEHEAEKLGAAYLTDCDRERLTNALLSVGVLTPGPA